MQPQTVYENGNPPSKFPGEKYLNSIVGPPTYCCLAFKLTFIYYLPTWMEYSDLSFVNWHKHLNLYIPTEVMKSKLKCFGLSGVG